MMRLQNGEGDNKALEKKARESNIYTAILFATTVIVLKAGS